VSEEAHIVLDGVAMAFGDRPVFRDLSCRFPRGRISVILGGSGSGKSTVLRMIGGLVRPQRGRILVDGVDVTGCAERELFDVRRKLGMLFQGGALLDSMTVAENCSFPLREHSRLDEAAIARTVLEKLDAVGLRDAGRLFPRQLSGGMTKRAALARAIVDTPAILLCDEPFSGLDPISARRIEALLVRLNRTLGMTLAVVSHDVESTRRMADHVVLLRAGCAVEGPFAALRDTDDAYVQAFLSDEVDEALPELAG
jgi:phospholipid/cholesterol/gamma-HCH transport system ATP-binding protein